MQANARTSLRRLRWIILESDMPVRNATMHSWAKFILGATWALNSCISLAQSKDEDDRLTAVQVAEDIEVFRREFLAVDVSYTSKARAEAESRLKELNGARRDPVALALEICRIVALADNAHSECRWPSSPKAGIQFMPIDGNYYVIGIEARNAALLGAQLQSLDGQTIKKAAESGMRVRGGVPAVRELAFAEMLRTPARLYALGYSATKNGVMYRFTSRTGATIEQRLVVSDPTPELTWLTPPDRAPWSQQDPDKPFRWKDAPTLDAIIVHLRRNSDAPEQHVMDFLQDAEANRARLGRRNVILDMRYNGGGDLLTTRDFFVAWPGRIPADGRIYVLEGARTFSAAITSIGYLKQAGGKRVVLVGEPPGDRMMFFAEGKEVKLPHSGVTVTASRQRHDYRDGCRKFDDCFAGVAQPGGRAAPNDGQFARMPITLKELEPEIPVRMTLADLQAGKDAAMEAVAEQVARSRN
jgi:hypothetical protein